MKALVWHGKEDVRISDVPEPSAGKGEVKIRVQVCGICGSDLHEYRSGPVIIPRKPHPLTGKEPPVIIGHEFSGDVVEVGEGVSRIAVGDRVAVNACLVCNECYWCRKGAYNLCAKLGSIGFAHDGAFAEYVSVPEYTCFKIPESVSYEQGSFVEPVAVAVHAVKRSRIKPGETVAVVGAGPIGLLVMQSAFASGAGKVYVVEPMPSRRELAKKLGATEVFDPTQGDPGKMIHPLTDGLRADIVFECVGKPASLETALKMSGKGARIVIAGIFTQPVEFPFIRMQAHEKELIGSSAYPDEFPAAINFLADGRVKVDSLINSRITLDEIIEKGFKELIENPEKHIKIVVTP
ncbi:MAG: 2,3-butanediol dehydrogenase [Candidatus Schekmanbacteria bacterium]|nr:MAG: 2,3-butanediol dehydrogenase [Candidatus Schekmanbacteria bacterium]